MIPELQYPGKEPDLIDPNDFPKWIIEEDNDFLVINKPGNVVCHPSKNGPWSSLVGAAREYTGLDLVHLVHRLDRETSGICLLAKHRKAARVSQMAFQHKQVSKEYIAIVEGDFLEAQHVNKHLAKDLDSAVWVKQAVRKSNSSQRAETEFLPIAQGGGYSLVRVLPVTGRKHQIRIHASYLGHPIVGDKVYGPDESLYLEFIDSGWTERMDDLLILPRQALHARTLSLDAPECSRTWTAPLPQDLHWFVTNKMQLNPEELPW